MKGTAITTYRCRRVAGLFRFAGLLLGLILLAGPAGAERDVDDIEELIPHRETALERYRLLANGGRPVDALLFQAQPPPAAPVRNCAEWDPVTGVLIRYPIGLPYALLRDLDDDVTLHVVVDSSFFAAAQYYFVANGVDTSMVQWLVKANNSIWTRDYGPWFVFDGQGDLTIIDHFYNRPWRTSDNKIPGELGAQLGIPVVAHDMWHAGGNYMTDGAHLSMSTNLVYEEALAYNGMSPEEVRSLMTDYYGVLSYSVISDIESGGIHHIDTWGKYLDEETVLIKEVATSHHTYAALEQRATLIASLIASTGRPYDVHRVYCHDIGGGNPAAYTNSLIANHRIYVPLFGEAAHDSAAVQAYRAAAPGYEVIGHFFSGFITDDALHCRIKGVMDVGMLRVAHVPLAGDVAGPATVRAEVRAHSEAGLAAVEIRYRVGDGASTPAPMVSVGGYEYEATIPSSPSEATIDYYVLASDLSGREEGHPRPAPAAWHSFTMPGRATGVDESVPSVAITPEAYPNPFADRTRFAFELRFAESVELDVYDVRGRRVRRVAHGPRAPGHHEFEWDGRDETGRLVPSGVYYFRLRAAGLVHSRPVVLIR